MAEYLVEKIMNLDKISNEETETNSVKTSLNELKDDDDEILENNASESENL